jgi:hypothetical protein
MLWINIGPIYAKVDTSAQLVIYGGLTTGAGQSTLFWT